MTDLSALGNTVGASWTRPIVFTAGHYKFAGQVMPYFSATLTITEALRNLVLAHQLPVNADDPVRLDELMQRVLDDERAGEDIVAYLRGPGRIKFFNSLTVVLLPTTPGGRPVDEFGPPLDPPATFDVNNEAYDVQRAGGVIVRRLKNGEAGHLLWQPDTVRPVIIDGQHRFAALRSLYATNPQILEADDSRIPVLFVAPAAGLGFRAPSGAPTSIIATSRAIFTDINKNAKRVSSERQFLLDDVSFSAVAMRRILTDGIGGTFAELADEVPARIPLATIDWTRTNWTRFDELDWPFISTIPALHQLVVQSMDKQPGEQDWTQWRVWINWVSDQLSPSSPWNRRELINRLSVAEEREDSFLLKAAEFNAAIAAYPDTRGQIVALPLTHLTPYARMIAELRDDALLGGRYELWLGQDDRGRQAYVARYGDDDLARKAAVVARRVKTAYRLAYQVVFQRAFILAATEIYDAWSGLAGYWGLEDASANAVLMHWIELFNERVAPLLTDDDFWRGTAVAADGTLHYVQVPMRGVSGLILLITVVDWAELSGDAEGQPDATDKFAKMTKYFSRRSETVVPADDEAENEDEEELPYGPVADHGLRLLDDDPYDASADYYATSVAAKWVDMLAIRRGPANGVVPALVRLATRWYRDSLRRYASSIHLATHGTAPDPEALTSMVTALGARRLSVATRGPDAAR